MKILIPVDGSDLSLDAVKWVTEHADWYRDKPALELVHAHAPLPQRMRLSTAASDDEIRSHYEADGQSALARAKQMLDGAGLAYSARVLVGSVVESIARHAEQSECDVIVMATRGLGSVSNLLIGSTAIKMLHISTVPVQVVK